MLKRVVFLGTPEFACPALEHLAGRTDLEVVLVVTQPDRPAGRGRKMQAPPVKGLALDLDRPVHQVSSLRTVGARRPLMDARPDLIVVAAFGLILGKSILSLPPLGCVNLHASLLPLYRGANPVAAAILNGDASTGLSLMRMDTGLDTGEIYDQERLDITPEDTTASLTTRLSLAGASVLARNLPDLLNGTAVAKAQGPGATCTRPMVKDDGWIDWTLPAESIERHVRAMWPWPRAWTTLPDGTRVQIRAAHVVHDGRFIDPGTILASHNSLSVQCGQDSLQLDQVQLAGRKPANGAILVSRGASASVMRLGQVGVPEPAGPLISMCDAE